MLAQIYTVIINRAGSGGTQCYAARVHVNHVDYLLIDKEELDVPPATRIKAWFIAWGHLSLPRSTKEWGMLQMQYIGLLNTDKHRKGPVQMFIQGRGSQERYVLDRLPDGSRRGSAIRRRRRQLCAMSREPI